MDDGIHIVETVEKKAWTCPWNDVIFHLLLTFDLVDDLVMHVSYRFF